MGWLETECLESLVMLRGETPLWFETRRGVRVAIVAWMPDNVGGAKGGRKMNA